MLTKFISVSETRFQNTETALKNQQVLIQGLENQTGQLAKMNSKRPQGSLPSNTETIPREQFHVITVRDTEGLVEPKLELRQESVVSQCKVEETPRKSEIEPRSSLYDKSITTHDEWRLQIDELDKWRSHVKEKLRIHNAKPKRLHDELKDGTNHFKVGDQVLIDTTDPRITTSELNANGTTPFTVLNIFPYGTVKRERGVSNS
ncbi:hypothetical protein GOBAR_AA30776 [Gossypium barbadense]|uniref:Integrase catalytic domain-containing protein n=1 Tax=Gossypium barbadense TaxID=3634 RepID=A0A2P5WFS2_GOSBA|nr:hypothetical protein GOBAR_AA30776 [Gossypium barbadense]